MHNFNFRAIFTFVFSFIPNKFLPVHSKFIYRLLLVIATNCVTFLCHLPGSLCIIDLRAVCVFARPVINLIFMCSSHNS